MFFYYFFFLSQNRCDSETLKRQNDDHLDPPSTRKRRKTSEGSVNLSDLQSPMSCIIQAVENLSTDSDLIADGSRTACLPTVAGKHHDLKSISPETVSSLVIIHKGYEREDAENCASFEMKNYESYKGEEKTRCTKAKSA